MILSLFFTFFNIGLFTFGGGYAMIPMITEEVMEKGWLSMSQLIDFIGIAESTPGVFAVNIATFVGTAQKGLLGAFFATLGVILPSFCIILFLATQMEKIKSNPHFVAVLSYLKPTVLALILSATLSIATSVLFPQEGWNSTGLIILLILWGIHQWKKLPTLGVLLLSAGLGILFY